MPAGGARAGAAQCGALRRPPALGDAGDGEMSRAVTETKLDNDMLQLHNKHDNDAQKQAR